MPLCLGARNARYVMNKQVLVIIAKLGNRMDWSIGPSNIYICQLHRSCM